MRIFEDFDADWCSSQEKNIDIDCSRANFAEILLHTLNLLIKIVLVKELHQRSFPFWFCDRNGFLKAKFARNFLIAPRNKRILVIQHRKLRLAIKENTNGSSLFQSAHLFVPFTKPNTKQFSPWNPIGSDLIDLGSARVIRSAFARNKKQDKQIGLAPGDGPRAPEGQAPWYMSVTIWFASLLIHHDVLFTIYLVESLNLTLLDSSPQLSELFPCRRVFQQTLDTLAGSETGVVSTIMRS